MSIINRSVRLGMFRLAVLNAGSELIVNRVIRDLIEGKIAKVVSTYEKFSNHYFFDPPLDNQTLVPFSDILNALLSLDSAGFLSSEESFTTYCVECFAMGLNLVGRCPSCRSSKIKKGRVILHKCGYQDFEELFRQGDSWTCPSCKQKLYRLEADYRDEGMRYKCVACSSIFEKYSTQYQCPECQASYPEGQEPSVNFKVYTPTELLLERKFFAHNSFELSDLVARHLSKMGYDVRNSLLLEESGEAFYWDVAATLRGSTPKRRVGVSVLPLNSSLEKEEVNRLILKKKRTGFESVVVVSPADAEADLSLKLSRKGIYLLDSKKPISQSQRELEQAVVPFLPK
jgi:hypothetical protein